MISDGLATESSPTLTFANRPFMKIAVQTIPGMMLLYRIFDLPPAFWSS